MNDLHSLKSRIKYSRLYKRDSLERLYIRYGTNTKTVKTSAWFEIVNDKLTVFVKVENYRHPNFYDVDTAMRYKSEIEEQYHEIINECEMTRVKMPLNERLKDSITPVHENSMKHQAEALRFACSMKATALYADTGTGKTKIAIDLAVSRYEAGQINKVLVFAPVSTKKNFQNQINEWCKCQELYWHIIGSESMSSSERTYLSALDYADSQTLIIVDESHLIKTPTAKRSKRIKAVADKSSYKLVMTGTPVTDNVHNLYMQYAVLSQDIIGVNEWSKFEKKFLLMGGRNNDEIVGYKNIDYLMGLLEPYTYQITKEECLNLPSKKNELHINKLSEMQWNFYEKEKDDLLEIIQSDDFQATDIFQAFTRMQQICSGYYKFGNKKMLLDSNKTDLFKKINTDKPLVIFCKYLFEIDAVVRYFGADKCAVFTGQNPKERNCQLSDFISGKKQYFVATMQSGGTGLNGLQTVCNEVVFYSNSFSYFHRKQSIGRIDRKGQTKEMIIHDFRTNANIDEKILTNLKRKGNLADEIKSLMKDKTELKKYIQEL